ncbi:MAG: hypothetical protein F6K30_24010 [Cyanothece sp. SIO2G6]|nr:hypothetical protein [Cyanothece sp. SIO2G6]
MTRVLCSSLKQNIGRMAIAPPYNRASAAGYRGRSLIGCQSRRLRLQRVGWALMPIRPFPAF